MKIDLEAAGWTKTTKLEPGVLKRVYVTWVHPSGMEIQGYQDDYGRPWTAGARDKAGAYQFLSGKDHKRKRYGSIVKGACRCFATPEAAALAATKEYNPDLLKGIAKPTRRRDHKDATNGVSGSIVRS